MNNTKNNIIDKIYNPFVIEAGRIAFYLGLLFEVVILILDRADWINPYQSFMFRATFALFFFKCVCTRYDKKQIIFVISSLVFAFLSYRLCGKDEVFRAMVFIIAMKDLDLNRTLKFNYIFTSIGIGFLGILSIFGIMGEVLATPGYAEKAEAFMLSFGLGSSNTWAIQIWVLIAVMIYIYYDRLSRYIYPIIIVSGFVLYAVSRTSAALIMMVFTGLVYSIIAFFPRIKNSKLPYILAVFAVAFSVGFSIFAAKISRWWEEQPLWQQKLDRMLTGRITYLYAFENGGGVLSNWKLFGDSNYEQYFDMGIVRMFWWYGIIPGALCVAAILYLIYYCYKKKDVNMLALTASIVIFSIFEAHFISEFIIRNYLIFILGAVWYREICISQNEKPMHVAFYINSLSKGGAERVFCNLAEYFASQGMKVTMITQYKYDNEYVLSSNIDRVVSDLTKEEEKGRIYNFFARYMKLHHILVKTNADIILSTIGKNNFMALCGCVFIPTKAVVSIVADPGEEYNTRLMRILMQLLFANADGIVMQTTKSLDFMKFGLKNKCVILPNSVAAEFVVPRFEGHRDKKIYTVGRMDANKNHKMAIYAFANIADKYNDAELILIGDGELRAELENLCVKLGIVNRVTFTGIVSDVPKRLETAYIFLLTSFTEGMPNTLLEAMALGTACISTDCPCGGPYDLITPGIDGILVPVDDVDALTKELDKLLSDENKTMQLGINAHKTMEAYVPDKVNDRWNAYFTKIVQS